MSTMSGRVCENKDGSRQMLHKCLTTALCPTQDQNTPLIQRLNQRKCRLFIDTSPSVKYDMYFVCVCNLWQFSGFYLPYTNGHARADSLLGDSNQAIDKFGRRGWPNPKPLDSLPLFFLVRHVWCFSGSQLHWWHSFLSYFDCICGFCSSLLLKHWYGFTLSIMSSSGLHDTEQM